MSLGVGPVSSEFLQDFAGRRLFLALDAYDEPTLWGADPDHPDKPEALLRRCDVAERWRGPVWKLLTDALGIDV